MYTGLLDQNWSRNLFRSIGYPIGPLLKLHQDNQATIKRVLMDRITTKSRPIEVIIISLHELHIRKKFNMADTRSNMHLTDLNSKPHGGKSIRNIIDHAIRSHYYPPPQGQNTTNFFAQIRFMDPPTSILIQRRKVSFVMPEIKVLIGVLFRQYN